MVTGFIGGYLLRKSHHGGIRAAKAPLRKRGCAPFVHGVVRASGPGRRKLRQCRQQGGLFTCDSEVPVPSEWPWARAGHIRRYLVGRAS